MADEAEPILLVPELPDPELELPLLAALEPDAEPLLPEPVVKPDDDGPDSPGPWVPERPAAPAEPDDPPGPLEPEVARPDERADPDEADPVAEAEPDAPPPVDPDIWLEVCVAGPDGPDDPPAPLPELLMDTGLELAPPLVPPWTLAPVTELPVAPDEALPVELPVEPPLDPPVEVPLAGPLLPLPVVVPALLPAAAGGGGVAAVAAGPLFSAATRARLEISPTTGAKVGDEGFQSNRCRHLGTFGYRSRCIRKCAWWHRAPVAGSPVLL